MPTPAYVTVPNPATGDVVAASHVDDLATNASYLKDRVDNPPRAAVYHNAAQSLATATDTALLFNSEYADSAALHSTASLTTRLTIPTGEGGTWLFTAHIEFAANATGERKLFFLYNSATDLGGDTKNAAASGVTKLSSAITLVGISAGDYLEVMAAQNSGGGLNVSANPRFSAIRIA